MAFLEKLRAVITESFSQMKCDANKIDVYFSCAILLAEIARSDFEIDEKENQMISNVLKNSFELTTTQAKQLTMQALEQVEELTSLHDYTQSINQTLTIGDKKKLITGLWQVAYADGQLASHETHWIKRIADLLHVDRTFVFECKEKARVL